MKKKIFLFLLAFLLVPWMRVKAFERDLSVSLIPMVNYPEDVQAGETIAYDIMVQLVNDRVSMDFIYDSNVFELIGTESYDGFTLTNDGNHFTITLNGDEDGAGRAGTVRLQVKNGVSDQQTTVRLDEIRDPDHSDVTSESVEEVTNIGYRNNYLDRIALSTGTISPEFSGDINDYTILVSEDTNEITLEATLLHPDYANILEGSSQMVTLTEQDTEVTFTVQSNRGEQNQYHFFIQKGSLAPTVDLSLRYLISNYGYINFDPVVTQYEIRVPSTLSELELYAEANSDDVILEYPKITALEEEITTIEVRVRKTNNETEMANIYQINVFKDATLNTLESVNTLQDLRWGDADFVFDPNRDVIYFDLNDVTEDGLLDIGYVPTSEEASVSIQGNQNLTEDSVIRIIVTAANGENREYQLLPNTKQSTSTTSILLIVVGVILVISGIGALYVMYKKGGKKHANTKKQ